MKSKPRLALLAPAAMVLNFVAQLPVSHAAEEMAGIAPEVQQFMQKYCLDCHGADQESATLRFDTLPRAIGDEALAQSWQDILDALNLSQMPPPDAEQPSKEELSNVLETLTMNLADARRRLTDSGGQVVLRRLNRRDYRETIKALFNVPVDVGLLPDDGEVNGFDTLGQAHNFSSLHMERYLELGRQALDRAYPTNGRRPQSRVTHSEPEEMVRRQLSENLPRLLDRIEKHQTPKLRLRKEVTEMEVRLSREYLATEVSKTGALIPYRGLNPSTHINVGNQDQTGLFKVRVRCGAVADRSEPTRDLYLKVIRGEYRSKVPDAIDYYQISGTVAEPQIIEFNVYLDDVRSNRIAFERRHVLGEVLEQFAETRDYFFRYPQVAHLLNDTQPDLWIDWIACEGPLDEPAAPLSGARLLGDRKPRDLSAEEVRSLLHQFAYTAFRHREPEAEYVGRLVGIYDASREHGSEPIDALKDAMSVVLASPRFLFLEEPAAESEERRNLSDRELAIRLAYFLWSAPPDEELYRVAQRGQLHQPEILAGQVDRMLRSERSELFVEAFLTQWLELDRLQLIDAEVAGSEEYDDAVHRLSKAEVLAFFRHLLQEDLPATNLLDSNFVVVNNILADFYGLPTVVGDDFRPVQLPADSVRGGMLGQSAILALTGTGTRTSPVERGVFVLRKLLDRPPPPAPANVPMLDEAQVGALSIRETLATHMTKAQCQSCHRRIDPLGFALENFDPVGRWRNEVISSDGTTRFPIEMAGLMPDGKRPFRDYQEMKQRLLEDRNAMLSGLTEALMTYAVGRTIGFSDQELIDELVQETAAEGYGLRTLVHKIVISKPFTTK